MSTNFDDSGLLAGLPEALLISTLEGEIVFSNRALEVLSGYSPNDLLGAHLSRLLPTPERRRVQVVEWLNRWASDPNPDQLRYLNLEMVDARGDTHLVSVRVSTHKQDDGHYFVVVLRDVTSQQETMARLRHAQLVTNRILAIGEDAVLSIDAKGTVTYWNATASRLFGYSEHEVLGKSLSILLPGTVAERHESAVQSFMKGTAASRMMGERGEIVGRHKDGHIMPLEASITKTTIDGHVVMSAQIRDISGRKKAEVALLESEARFRAIFENAFEAIVLMNPLGRVLEVNAAARALLADGPNGVGMNFWDLNWWPTQGDPNLVSQSRESLKENIEECGEGSVIRTRVSLALKDGSRELDFSLIPVQTSPDHVAYILAEGRDLTSLS